MSVIDNIYHRIFIFSQTQMDKMLEIEKKRGSVAPVFGTVRQFLDLLASIAARQNEKETDNDTNELPAN